MGDYDVRERGLRGRTARTLRASPRPGLDCVTAALTAQTLLCAILILCVFMVKKADEPFYHKLKTQYAGMCAPASAIDWEAVFGRASGGGVLDKAKSLAEEFFSAKPLAEDEAGPETGAEAASGSPPGYDYLGVEGTGSGGLMPVSGDGGPMSAPPGSSLSPVYLNARLKPPVTGVITSEFAYRYHPLSGESDFHTGLDVAAEEGRAILAALPGEVSEVGENEIYGKYIIIKHATNLSTSYSHCSEILAEEGMAVRQGERVAKVGQTGMVTGPHLHFSVIVEGQFVDPEWVLSDSIRLVD